MEKLNDLIIARTEDLTVAYSNIPVLWDIDLEIPRGKLVAVVGPNGSGKSTLIKTMLGQVKPVTGKVDFYLTTQRNSLKSNSIGYVPQSDSVDWDFPATVLDVVLMGLYGKLGWVRRPSAHDKAEAIKALEMVGLKDFASRQISQLSGGQQQRVFLARALAQKAELYFLDEPFKGVDVQTEKVIIEILKNMRYEGKTVVAVHHDLTTVEEYFDWVVIINKIIIANGALKEVFTKENIAAAYKGMALQHTALDKEEARR